MKKRKNVAIGVAVIIGLLGAVVGIVEYLVPGTAYLVYARLLEMFQ